MKPPVIRYRKSLKLDQRFNDTHTKNLSSIFFTLIIGIIVGAMGSIFRLALTYIEVFRDNLYAGTGLARAFNAPFAGMIGGGYHTIKEALDHFFPSLIRSWRFCCCRNGRHICINGKSPTHRISACSWNDIKLWIDIIFNNHHSNSIVSYTTTWQWTNLHNIVKTWFDNQKICLMRPK